MGFDLRPHLLNVYDFIKSNMILNSIALLNADTYAPAQSQADVLLGAVPKLSGAQDVFPRYQIQQEQHCTARQMVLKLPVSFFFYFLKVRCMLPVDENKQYVVIKK